MLSSQQNSTPWSVTSAALLASGQAWQGAADDTDQGLLYEPAAVSGLSLARPAMLPTASAACDSCMLPVGLVQLSAADIMSQTTHTVFILSCRWVLRAQLQLFSLHSALLVLPCEVRMPSDLSCALPSFPFTHIPTCRSSKSMQSCKAASVLRFISTRLLGLRPHLRRWQQTETQDIIRFDMCH